MLAVLILHGNLANLGDSSKPCELCDPCYSLEKADPTHTHTHPHPVAADMFKSVQRAPLCSISARAARLHCTPALRHSSAAGPGRSEAAAAAWLESLFTWLQKAGRGCGETVPGKKKREGLLSILADHCSFVTGQRLRRALQIAELYSNLYSERSRWTLVGSIWRRLQNKQAPTGKLLAALAGVFMWEDEKIKDDEMRRCAWELQALDVVKQQAAVGKASAQAEGGWEIVMEKKSFKVWRRPVEGSHLFEYRVFGSYTDVTPRQFFNVQLDTEYRKKWDALVIRLDVVDRDANTGSEVIHWATHFPYPMYSRDYVYVRRYEVDVENNLMVLVSRAVQHPGVPETQEFVRVHSYRSRMVIRPHKSFDENGFDYLLTYSDDPQTVFPRYCLSWMVSSGMPDFLEKLHTAALRAKNHEVGVHDYVGVMKQVQQASPERLEEGTHTAGSSHIYA